MLGFKFIKPTVLATLFFFAFFIGMADFVQAAPQDDDPLSKAKKLYQEGDYEGSISMLSEFIQKLRAVVEQKKNVSEAFYLLAKIYFEVGDDSKVDENLQKVFETYPAFNVQESNYGFKERVEKIRGQYLKGKESEVYAKEKELQKNESEMEQAKPTPKAVYQPSTKKEKKKFPILLVVAGVVVVAAVVVLVAGGSKKEEEKFDIRGNWIFVISQNGQTIGNIYYTFRGNIGDGIYFDHHGDRGTYTVTGRSMRMSYNSFLGVFEGQFQDQNNISGAWRDSAASGTFTASRGGQGGLENTSAETTGSVNQISLKTAQ